MARGRGAEESIRFEIERSGPMTFHRFMELALYSGAAGYYGSERERIGSGGDFLTSPEIHPAFGALIARQLEQLWVEMGRPSPFKVVENGAGRATLALDILSYCALWTPQFHDALGYSILEPNPAAASRQRESLAQYPEVAAKVQWRISPTLDLKEGSLVGCVLSNELLDAFPVHRVRNEAGRLQELYVGLEGSKLVDVPGEPSNPAILSYFNRLGLLPREGCTAEVNLDALAWIRRVAAVLKRGAAITIDYGYPAAELYSSRHCDGSLLCFFRHTVNGDPYLRIGDQDITTHLDFTSISREAAEAGLRSAGLTTQREFLRGLGMDGYRRTLADLGLRQRDYEANAIAMDALMHPEGLGRIGVMIHVKGVGGFSPVGLRKEGLQSDDMGRDFAVEPPPLLRPSQLRLNAGITSELSLQETEAMWNELMGEEDEQ